MKKLLVVIDYQNDFVNGSLGFQEAVALEDYLADLIKEYHNNNDDVIFTYDTHQKNYLTTQEGKNLPVAHCLENTEGWQLYGKIHDLANICVISNAIIIKAALPEASIIIDCLGIASNDPLLEQKSIDIMENLHMKIINKKR